MRRPDRHNEIEINLLGSGQLTYLLGGRKTTIEPGRLALFWAAIPHQILSAPGCASYHVMTLPLALFLECRLPDRLVQPILHGQVITDPTARESDHQMMSQWHLDLKSSDDHRRRAILLETEARLLRLALALPEEKLSRPSVRLRKDHYTKAEQMACFIAQHYLEPLSVAEIGESVGLHPNYSMSLFKRVFATTLSAYLTQHRVAHAQRLLVTTDQQIVDVALSSGFGSLSRFNDVFRDSCGCSPRAYRQQHAI